MDRFLSRTKNACVAVLLATIGTGGRAGAATLLKQDFNARGAWLGFTTAATSVDVTATGGQKQSGTMDVYQSPTASGAFALTVQRKTATATAWSASIISPLLAVANTETNLGKLTLSFDHAVSAVRPITVWIESFNAQKVRTGGRQAVVYPAAPNFPLRSAVELSEMVAVGSGSFQPTDPYIKITYSMDSLPEGSAAEAMAELRVDNVVYATPAFYVKPNGDNRNSGRTEALAFATPQRALDLAQAGDIVLVMDGEYHVDLGGVASFRRAGTPTGWIVLKNYPGVRPTFSCTGWNTVSIGAGSKDNYSSVSLAYLEVRGLHVRNEADVVRTKYPDSIGKVDSRSNTNGIAIDGRYMTNVPHHIRFADNIVEYCPGQGLGALEADWVTIENNISRYNCWTTIYGTSGVSILGASNFDGANNVYKQLVRNNVCYRNETFEKWASAGKFSDGNGIILDVNKNTSDRPNSTYLGRTLVQSNLCFDNGGSGIHSYKGSRVDIINNTAYLNSASTELQYSQIFASTADDVRILNNILVAPVANLAAGEKAEPVNASNACTNMLVANNLYFGGNTAPTLGPGDVIADPLFVLPTRDGTIANFHLQPTSPAASKGVRYAFSPLLDLDGKQRLLIPSKGVYEK